VTVERWLAQLQAIGISLSKRALMRLLIDQPDEFLTETREVLQAGLATADWISVDDTGARHRGTNAVYTQIGNDSFAWFGTTASKSRQTFLERLRAGHTDYVVNDVALEYRREHDRSGSWPGTPSAIWRSSALPRFRSLPIRCASPPRASCGGR
jgi:hypothetical protein